MSISQPPESDLSEPVSGGSGPENGRPRNLLERLLDRLASLCLLVAGVLLVCLIVIFGWLVFGRYVLNDTPTWVEQASLVLVVYVTFLGAAVGVHRKSHLSIDFLREAMPRGPRTALRILADAAMIVFGGFMVWQGWGLVSGNLHRAIPMIGVSESWRAAPLVACGALIIVFCGADMILRATRSRKREA